MTVVLTDAQAQDAHLLGLLYNKYNALLLNYEAAAKTLGISVKSLERKVVIGEIQKVQIGGCVRISITEILRVAREGTR